MLSRGGEMADTLVLEASDASRAGSSPAPGTKQKGCTMPYYNYKQDFKVARKTEAQVADLLCKALDLTVHSWCTTKDYDVLMVDSFNYPVAYEIKEDFTCKRTGNVGVEYSCRGKDSGIVTTKANMYVWKIHAPDNTIRVYEMPVAQLREAIDNNLWFRSVIGGDEFSESKNYLFRLSFLEENAILVGYLDN